MNEQIVKEYREVLARPKFHFTEEIIRVPEFKRLLGKYYEGEDISVIAAFMKERCWKTIES